MLFIRSRNEVERIADVYEAIGVLILEILISNIQTTQKFEDKPNGPIV
jgi:hypothetical protein